MVHTYYVICERKGGGGEEEEKRRRKYFTERSINPILEAAQHPSHLPLRELPLCRVKGDTPLSDGRLGPPFFSFRQQPFRRQENIGNPPPSPSPPPPFSLSLYFSLFYLIHSEFSGGGGEGGVLATSEPFPSPVYPPPQLVFPASMLLLKIQFSLPGEKGGWVERGGDP